MQGIIIPPFKLMGHPCALWRQTVHLKACLQIQPPEAEDSGKLLKKSVQHSNYQMQIMRITHI